MLNRLQDVFASLNSHEVKYVVIGGIAAVLITPEGLLANEITIFKDRVRIDVLTSTPGISFDEAWSKRQIMQYQGQSFPVLNRSHLVATKRAAGRPIDLEDVRILDEGSEHQS